MHDLFLSVVCHRGAAPRRLLTRPPRFVFLDVLPHRTLLFCSCFFGFLRFLFVLLLSLHSITLLSFTSFWSYHFISDSYVSHSRLFCFPGFTFLMFSFTPSSSTLFLFLPLLFASFASLNSSLLLLLLLLLLRLLSFLCVACVSCGFHPISLILPQSRPTCLILIFPFYTFVSYTFNLSSYLLFLFHLPYIFFFSFFRIFRPTDLFSPGSASSYSSSHISFCCLFFI